MRPSASPFPSRPYPLPSASGSLDPALLLGGASSPLPALSNADCRLSSTTPVVPSVLATPSPTATKHESSMSPHALTYPTATVPVDVSISALSGSGPFSTRLQYIETLQKQFALALGQGRRQQLTIKLSAGLAANLTLELHAIEGKILMCRALVSRTLSFIVWYTNQCVHSLPVSQFRGRCS